jgi:hypothetical protein
MIEPELLCMQHLLGEHGEIHKHKHNFEKGHSITGRIAINAVEPLSLKSRHDALEAEIVKRAIKAGRKPPSSPFQQPDLKHYAPNEINYKINVEQNRLLLIQRCSNCKQLNEEGGK